MQESRPGPKPRGPFEDKRKTLTTRITEATRAKLEAAAAASGHSLSQEIELQLDRAFAGEQALGGPRVSALLRSLVDTIRLSGAGLDDQWLDDPNRRRAVLGQMRGRLDRIQVEMAEKEQSTLENVLKAARAVVWWRYYGGDDGWTKLQEAIGRLEELVGRPQAEKEIY